MKHLITVIRFMLVRMVRDVPSMIMCLLTPMLLIPILGAVFSWIPQDVPYLRGITDVRAFFAFGILIMFQLFGGAYSLTYVKTAFLSPMKWRLTALPCRSGVMVLGIVAAATIVSLCQGAVLVAVSRFALGVHWGNILVVFLTVLGVSLLSQLVCLTILLAVRNPGAASGIAWIYAYGCCVLGGLIFPLPVEKPVIRFLMDFGTPYSLAQTAMRQSATGGSMATVALCIFVLFLAAALFGFLTVLMGRRKLA